ncbi:heat-inducible transcriptional repressor HrcA [Thiofilum flexile]|uniref:heat-inducible transcriptional repressor HrcA n=1 Tax=Thiofilum flexile TaxID=125627 RepID=UPI00039E5232|nr:heat-inducible transcriptional repressor HrcA [Thiofilum flexile]
MQSSIAMPPLNERAQRILKVLIEEYIQDGQPVGSRTLAKRSGLDLSSATIRNVMADLEEMGYIHSPHTSAGRVPTSHGYRFFVDTLVQVKPLEAFYIQQLQGRLSTQLDAHSLVQSASSMLSMITSLTGVVTLPRRQPALIKQIEFVRLSTHQVLVVLVLERNEVQNRIIQVDQPFTTTELHQAASFLNEYLTGKTLHQAREVLLQAMNQDREAMNALMLSAIELGEKAFDQAETESREDCVIAGETNLMSYDDLSDVSKLRDLFGAFTKKRELLSLLDKSIQADGVQIFIGREAGLEVFDDCSLVTAPYSLEDEHIGVLGVIGPKRMPYERVIPIVDLTAKLLSMAMQRD